MSDYADAINRAMQEHIELHRDYGGLLAMAGIPLSELEEVSFDAKRYIREGYARQLADFPNN